MKKKDRKRRHVVGGSTSGCDSGYCGGYGLKSVEKGVNAVGRGGLILRDRRFNRVLRVPAALSWVIQ